MWRGGVLSFGRCCVHDFYFSVSRAQEVSLAPLGPQASQAFPESQADSG